MSYTATYNRQPLVRGDTLLGWSVAITQDGLPVDITSARSQLRYVGGSLVHTFDLQVVGNVVTYADVEAEVTATWPLLPLAYDLELTLADGRVVTWLKGSQEITIDRTY